jgi:hypothetical protein
VREQDEELKKELASMAHTFEEQRQPWEPAIKESFRFCSPGRTFYAPDSQTQDKTPPIIYNGRGVIANTTASSGFQGYTANKRSEWFLLGIEDQTTMKLPGVADWLEVWQRILSAHFTRSGFYEALGEIVPDGHAGALGSIYCEEDQKGQRIIYQARHPLGVWIQENCFGEVDTHLEDIWMTAKAAKERFGDNLTEKNLDLAKTNPYQPRTIRHLVMPMDKRYLEFAQITVDERMRFLSVWFEAGTNDIIDVGAYWEFPYGDWRYRKNSGEVYPRGPGLDALNDMLAGNQMTRSRIQLGNLVADPPMQWPDGLEGDDELIPGAHFYYKGSMKDKGINPVPLGANYPITIDNENRQDAIIDQHFMVPLYQMLQGLERQVTAREVIERMGEKASLLGPVVGRYESEVLYPMIRRTFNLLLRAGRGPAPPQSVLDARKAGEPIKIEFMGYLSQITKRYYETSSFNATLAYAAGVVQLESMSGQQPTSLDWLDFDRAMPGGLEAAGARASFIREEPDVAKIRQGRAAAMAAAVQEQKQQLAAETLLGNADKLGKRPEPGSPMTEIDQLAPAGVP